MCKHQSPPNKRRGNDDVIPNMELRLLHKGGRQTSTAVVFGMFTFDFTINILSHEQIVASEMTKLQERVLGRDDLQINENFI